MSPKNFNYERPTIPAEVPARWFAKGGAGQRVSDHPLDTIRHWGIGAGFSRADEVLNPSSPLAREVLGVERPHPADVLLGVEVLSDASMLKVMHIWDDCTCDEPFAWYYAA
jgi:hypothetical protein